MIDLWLFSIHWHLFIGFLIGCVAMLVIVSLLIASESKPENEFYINALAEEREEKRELQEKVNRLTDRNRRLIDTLGKSRVEELMK